MRVVLQRVSEAEVSVGAAEVARIGAGLLLFVGIAPGDGHAQVEAAARKISGLRIFEDGEERMNLSPEDVRAELLVVSQFTLLANTDKGRRPSFERAAAPGQAEPLVEALTTSLRERGFRVATGRFGAHMRVELVNDGPVTLVLDFD